jgi:hypothetical protein
MVPFNDLLEAENFTLAVSSLAKDFRDKYEFPLIHQIGVVVPDVEKAAAELEEKGIGPFFIASGSLALWNERRRLGHFKGKMGIAYHKGFEVELLEPGEGSSFYKDCIDPDCPMVVQHLGFLVNNVDVHAAHLESHGYPTWIRGTIRSIPLSVEFAYMDTVDETGLVLEFISWRLLGIPFRIPQAAFHTIGRVEKATGIRCLPL